MTAVSDTFDANVNNWDTDTGSFAWQSGGYGRCGGGGVYTVTIYDASAIGDGSTALYCEADYLLAGYNNFDYPGVLLSEVSTDDLDCFRVSNGTNGDATAYITEVIGGTSDDIATTSNTISASGTMRVEWDPSDESIRYLVDDVEVLSATASGSVAPAYGGLHHYSGSTACDFDNFAGDTLGASAIDLVVADLAVAVTADAPTLTQVHALTVADLAVAAAVDSVALTQVHSLTVTDVSVAAAVDSVALTQVHSLTVTDVSVAAAVDSVALTQVHDLTVTDVAVAVAVDAVALSVGAVDLIVSDASVSTTIDSVALTQAHELGVADLSVGSSIETPTLVVGGITVSPADLAVSVTVGSVSVTQVHNLSVADLDAASTIDAVTLSVDAVDLTVPGSFVATSVDSVSLTVDAVGLSVADLSIGSSIEPVALAQTHNLAVADVSVTVSIDAVVLLGALRGGSAATSGGRRGDAQLVTGRLHDAVIPTAIPSGTVVVGGPPT